jgi:hypothetical protein
MYEGIVAIGFFFVYITLVNDLALSRMGITGLS